MEIHFNSFSPHKKLTRSILCCLCGKKINNIMDAHDPEPLAKRPNKICNVCNEDAVTERLRLMRESGM